MRAMSKSVSLEQAEWRGRSGMIYRLWHEALDSFVLSGSELYALSLEDRIIWAGALADVLNDMTNRTRFRRALRIADAAFRCPAPVEGLDRLSLAWDLEGALPLRARNAA